MAEIAFAGKIKKQSIYNFFDYFLLAAIIALTGFEFFFRDNTILYFAIGPISFILFVLKGGKISPKLLSMLGLLLLLFLLQSLTFNLPYNIAFTGTLRFFIYFSICHVIGLRFNTIYINIMYCICLSSLFLFTLTSISAIFYDLLLAASKNITSLGINDETYENWANPSQNIIIYVIPLLNTMRNCGPFWEPGMFAIFINIALAINLITNKRVLEKKNITFLIASISTLSTTSLLATFIIISYHFLFSVKYKYSMLFIMIMPFIAIPLFNSEYVGGKIDTNIETMDSSYSRFGAILVHYNEVLKSPFIGHGANVNKSIDSELGKYELNISPNGLSNIIRVYGIPFSILFYILLFKASIIISKISGSANKRDATLLFIVILTIAFSQDVTTRHFYYLLIMLPFSNINNIINFRKRLNNSTKRYG